MSDWQVGDLALCVASGRRTREGCVYTIADVLIPGSIDPEDGRTDDMLLLRFSQLIPNPRGEWSGENRFRKIRPDEHEACEPEFVTLLKRAKRPVSA